MNKKIKTILWIVILSIISYTSFGQKNIKDVTEIAFVYYVNRPYNIIVIPNIGRLHTFKIYRKTENDNEYKLAVVKKKPPLPMRFRVTPYGVIWKDKYFHTRDIAYKVIAFNRKGDELGEMKIIWDENK